MLRGTARQWLNDLEPNSIHCWVDMQIAFTKNFEGTYKRSFTVGDLQRCVQQPDEFSRAFLGSWLDMKNSCEGVHDQTAMHAFIEGLEKGTLLRHTLKRLQDENQLTLNSMIAEASTFAAADDDARGALQASALQPKKNTNKCKNPPEDKQSTDMVAMTFGGRGQGGGRGGGRGQQRSDEIAPAAARAPQTYEEWRDMPCVNHLDANGKSTHTNRTCKWVNDLKADPDSGYKRSRKSRPGEKGKRRKKLRS